MFNMRCMSFPQPGTDILICASENSLSGHYYARSRESPIRTDPVSLLNLFVAFFVVLAHVVHNGAPPAREGRAWTEPYS